MNWFKRQYRKVERKFKEEVKQYKELGFTGYIAQNTTTLVAEGADNLGFDETAQNLREKRSSIVKDAQEAQEKMEKKIKEEINQLEDLGFTEYIAQNTSTVIANTLDDMGLDGCAEEVRRQRNKAVEKTKRNPSDLDRKVKEEAKKEVKQDAQTKEPAKEEAKKNEPISNEIAVIKGVDLTNQPWPDNLMMHHSEDRVPSVPIGYEMFNNVEIKQGKGSDGQMKIAVSVDGKPHGPQIEFDGNNLVDVKIFDRGKLISPEKSTVNVATGEGVTDITCSVNDKPFGYKMRIDSSGNCEVQLIDANSLPMIPTKDCTVSSESKKEVKQDAQTKEPAKEEVKKELKIQKGEEVKVTSAEKATQSMLNYRVNKKENEPEIKKEEEVTETFTPQTIINTIIPNSIER